MTLRGGEWKGLGKAPSGFEETRPHGPFESCASFHCSTCSSTTICTSTAGHEEPTKGGSDSLVSFAAVLYIQCFRNADKRGGRAGLQWRLCWSEFVYQWSVQGIRSQRKDLRVADFFHRCSNVRPRQSRTTCHGDLRMGGLRLFGRPDLED